MKLEPYNLQLNISEDAYAWRYMSFEKLWDIVYNQKLYFARLDSFNDPLEGLNIGTRLKLSIQNETKVSASIKFKEKNTNSFKVTQAEINDAQFYHFISCWYLTKSNTQSNYSNYESLAMWNLYGNENSIVVKIALNKLIEIINASLEKYEDEEIYKALYGKADYFSIYDMTRNNIQEPVFVKDMSFEYEKEIRFVLVRDKILINRKYIKLPISDIDLLRNCIEIFCHPDMDIYTFQMMNEKLSTVKLKLQYSKLLTKKVVNRFIE